MKTNVKAWPDKLVILDYHSAVLACTSKTTHKHTPEVACSLGLSESLTYNKVFTFYICIQDLKVA